MSSHSTPAALPGRAIKCVNGDRMKYRWTAVATLLSLVAISGCGGSRPDTYPVTGTVQFANGTPVRTGFVEFLPAAGGPSARGVIGSRGDFRLGTFETADGAPAGEYVVLVTQHVRALTPAEAEKLGPAHQEHASEQVVVSVKYASRDSSDLRYTVSADSKNHFELSVDSHPTTGAPSR
jgi:hypothetical protein